MNQDNGDQYPSDQHPDNQRPNEMRQISHDLSELRTSVEAIGQAFQTEVSIKNFQTEVLTRLLSQQDVIVCLLEAISEQTCASLNEAHYQTEHQKSLRDAMNTLVELYKTEHPGALLELERLRELNRQIEACCPPEEPKPICEPRPCTVPPAPSEGSAPSSSVTAEPQEVSDAPFDPIEIVGEALEGRNEDRVPTPPIGPLRGSFAPTVQDVRLLQLTSDPDEARARGGAGNPVIFDKDSPFGNKVSFSGIPPDMSGAMRDRVVLMTGNTFAALSLDNGDNFTSLNPTTIFPSGPTRDAAGNALDGGLCCDQVVQYAPQIDRFIWLMQFCGTGALAATAPSCLSGASRLRIASASPEDIINSNGTAWTYWDLTSAMFNLGTTTMDYPDMSIGTNSLYISVDAVSTGLLVMRIPLTQIQSGGTINIDFTNPSDSRVAYGGHISQNTGDRVFWAGHNKTSQMRIFNWQENSGQYAWRDININSWPNSDYSSLCPDGTDWLNFLAGFPGSAVIGATRRFGGGFLGGPASEVWFAWTAARGGGFAHPHIQVVQIDTDNWNVTNQWQIWNADHAFAYPSLATNTNAEIGISLAWGGGSKFFASHAVGILGDFVVWFSEASDAALNRWGDYVTVRQASPRTSLYAAVGYSVLKNTPPATGTRFNPRYTLFGRESDVNPSEPPIVH